MKQKLIASLTERIKNEIVPQCAIKFLKTIEVEDILDSAIVTIYLYTRSNKKQKILMSEVITAIGHSIRNKFKLSRNSAHAAKAGAFVLWSFEQFGIVKVFLGQAYNNHQTFLIELVNEDALSALWESLTIEKTEKLPNLVPHSPWTSTRHVTGAMMIKTSHKDVLTSVTPETHPIVYETLNRAQHIGWKVNEFIYPIFVWALRNKADAFKDIWDIQNTESRNSKIREAKAVANIAGRFLDKTFYHLYYLDFRGRKYPATAFFHEQGTDGSKGLLLLAENKAIGEQGFFWLMISIANFWAGDAGREDGFKTDKIPLNDRVLWSLDNEEILLSYAENPKVNQGWMKADSPWQFLAACNEFKKAREHENITNDLFSYESGLVCYIDGSNNGSQHLSALTKDEVTAPHVNLVPSELPGDLYKYIADSVWARIEKSINSLNKSERDQIERFIDNLMDIKNKIAEAPIKSDSRKELINQIQKFKNSNKELMEKSSSIFWSRITDPKHRRKIVKRNVMTLPYGGTPYGLGQQQIDDARKHGIESLMQMEHKWGSFMGREIYEDCKVSLSRPMRLLGIFEEAGRRAESAGEFLSWKVPKTNFLVIQHYVEGRTKKVWIQYGPPKGESDNCGHYENTYQLHICHLEDTIPSKRKQSQGASPNAIHSLDAAHLMLTVCSCNFPVITVHDSYGCHLGNMAELFCVVREQFLELYKADPLNSFMTQIGGDISSLELGNLDIAQIIDSEYCFS